MGDLPERAISVRQSWAWAIIHAGKDVENRSVSAIRHMALDGVRSLAIHAAQGMTRDEYEDAQDFMGSIGVACPAAVDLVRGAIIGIVDIDGITRQSASPWFFGPRAIRLRNQRAIQPIYRSGSLGLFRWQEARLIEPPETPRWMMKKPTADDASRHCQALLL